VIWLHTFGERFTDAKNDRPAQPPRLPKGQSPRISADGAIPQGPSAMPDAITYDENQERLLIGQGYVEGVTPRMWSYEVSGKQVLRQWFSYRKANRDRPIIGDRRQPSKLSDVRPDHWLAEYTTELLNVLNVIGRLVDLEPSQADLLERICSGPTLSVSELRQAGAFAQPTGPTRKSRSARHQDHPSLFD
ncbi:MAG: type ISP restriction/modification enzyme, partial [Isosphaeraceae bacterium]